MRAAGKAGAARAMSPARTTTRPSASGRSTAPRARARPRCSKTSLRPTSWRRPACCANTTTPTTPSRTSRLHSPIVRAAISRVATACSACATMRSATWESSSAPPTTRPWRTSRRSCRRPRACSPGWTKPRGRLSWTRLTPSPMWSGALAGRTRASPRRRATCISPFRRITSSAGREARLA